MHIFILITISSSSATNFRTFSPSSLSSWYLFSCISCLRMCSFCAARALLTFHNRDSRGAETLLGYTSRISATSDSSFGSTPAEACRDLTTPVANAWLYGPNQIPVLKNVRTTKTTCPDLCHVQKDYAQKASPATFNHKSFKLQEKKTVRVSHHIKQK